MGFGPIGPPGDGTREDNLYSRLWRDHIPRTGCHTGGWDPSVPQARRRPSRRRTCVGLRAPHLRDTVGRRGAKHLGHPSDTRTGSTSDARPPRRPRHVGRTSDSRARGCAWSASDARAQRSDDPARAALQRHVRPPCGEHRGVVPAWRYFGHAPPRAHFRRTSREPSPDGQ